MFRITENNRGKILGIVIDELNKSTKVAILSKLFNREFIEKFFYQNSKEISKTPLSLNNYKRNKPYKRDIVLLMAYIYTNEGLFQGLLNMAPDYIKKFFRALVFQKEINIKSLPEDIKRSQILSEDYSNNMITSYRDDYINLLNPWLALFCIQGRQSRLPLNRVDYNISLSLPETTLDCVKSYVLTNDDFKLKSLPEKPSAKYYFETRNAHINELLLHYDFFIKGEIQILKSGKVSKKSFKRLQKLLNPSEFYPPGKVNPKLEHLRSQLILFLIRQNHKGKNIKAENPLDFIYDVLINYYEKNLMNQEFYEFFLEHLSSLFVFGNEVFGQKFLKLLKNLPVNEWIYVYDLLVYLDLYEYDLFNFRLYGNYKHYNKFDFYEFHDVTKKRLNIVDYPFLKGNLFLFAAFGVLDIAYNTPVNIDKKECTQNSAILQSPYNGLTHIKINNIGGYLLGKTDKPSINSYKKDKIKFMLDENTTLITIIGEDKFNELLLESYGTKVTEKRYKVDYQSLIKNCKSKKDLEDKIKRFKTDICSELPANWIRFFEKASNRFKSIKPEYNFSVLSIPSDDTELHHILTTDNILSSSIIKAENYKILVKYENVNKFKNRLKFYGYFL